MSFTELAKQQRHLQKKCGDQASEIERLERNLRIAAEFKSFMRGKVTFDNVDELRNALRDACKLEAKGELGRKMAMLEAQLADAKFAAANGGGGAMTAGNFERQAAEKEMANLELRIGELEELDVLFFSSL